MNFVINAQLDIDKLEKGAQMFETEEYRVIMEDRNLCDFIIENRSILNDEDVLDDPNRLKFILSRLEAIDIKLLDLLQL